MKTTERTMRHLRKLGLLVDVVERRIPYTNTTKDLFGIIDLISIGPDSTIGVQACGTDLGPHINKIMVDNKQATLDWLNSQERKLHIYAWRKVRNKLKNGKPGNSWRWKPRIIHVERKGDKLLWREIL